MWSISRAIFLKRRIEIDALALSVCRNQDRSTLSLPVTLAYSLGRRRTRARRLTLAETEGKMRIRRKDAAGGGCCKSEFHCSRPVSTRAGAGGRCAVQSDADRTDHARRGRHQSTGTCYVTAHAPPLTSR